MIETVDGSPSPSTSDIVSVTGSSLGASQGVAKTLWDLVLGSSDPDPEIFAAFAAYVGFAPYGWVLQSVAVAGALDAPEAFSRQCRRRRRRRHRPRRRK